MSQQVKDESSEIEEQPENKGRILGSAVVALGALLALVCAAAAVFFVIASLLQGKWLFALLGIVAFCVVYWALTRLLRVSANRTSAALKSYKQNKKGS